MDDFTYEVLRLLVSSIGLVAAYYPVMWVFGIANLAHLQRASNLFLVSAVLGTVLFSLRPDMGRWFQPIIDILCAFYWAKFVENN